MPTKNIIADHIEAWAEKDHSPDQTRIFSVSKSLTDTYSIEEQKDEKKQQNADPELSEELKEQLKEHSHLFRELFEEYKKLKSPSEKQEEMQEEVDRKVRQLFNFVYPHINKDATSLVGVLGLHLNSANSKVQDIIDNIYVSYIFAVVGYFNQVEAEKLLVIMKKEKKEKEESAELKGKGNDNKSAELRGKIKGFNEFLKADKVNENYKKNPLPPLEIMQVPPEIPANSIFTFFYRETHPSLGSLLMHSPQMGSEKERPRSDAIDKGNYTFTKKS